MIETFMIMENKTNITEMEWQITATIKNLMKINGSFYYWVLTGLMPLNYPQFKNERTRFNLTNTSTARVGGRE